MKIDYQTNYLILAAFPRLAGGKFIINCLGLSPESVLQHQSLADGQLQGKINSKDKFDQIMDRLEKTQNSWNDLDLGCQQYFGTGFIYYGRELSPIVQKIIDRRWYAFKVAHSVPEVEETARGWPNVPVIKFVNTETFLSTYRKKTLYHYHKTYWDKIRSPSWPKEPPMVQSAYDCLPLEVKQELKNSFEDDYQNLYLANFDRIDSTETWDCDWYLCQESTVESVKRLYHRFNLSGFNPDWVAGYWQLWTTTLLRLEKSL